MSNNGPRFQAREGSVLGHGCCFHASVIDTTEKPNDEKRLIAECFDIETAIIIARALNRDAMS